LVYYLGSRKDHALALEDVLGIVTLVVEHNIQGKVLLLALPVLLGVRPGVAKCSTINQDLGFVCPNLFPARLVPLHTIV
jgi:hypothetical protein